MASLFDTGAFGRLSREEHSAVAMAIRFSPPVICLHVAAEWIYGAKWAQVSEANLRSARAFIAAHEILVPSVATAEIYTDLRVIAHRAGQENLPDADFWIAAHAIENRLPLISLDRHFTLFEEVNLHLL